MRAKLYILHMTASFYNQKIDTFSQLGRVPKAPGVTGPFNFCTFSRQNANFTEKQRKLEKNVGKYC